LNCWEHLIELFGYNKNNLKLNIMKTKNKLKVTIDAIGNGARLVYLENNPHGFVSVTKVHKSSKQYSRKNKNKKELWY
jgi:hypothetical protein